MKKTSDAQPPLTPAPLTDEQLEQAAGGKVPKSALIRCDKLGSPLCKFSRCTAACKYYSLGPINDYI